MLEYGILGPVELRVDGRALELSSPKQRALLGTGLLNANTLVSAGRLVDAIWGEHPPPSASALVQTYVCRLRRLIVPSGPGPIITRSPGYLVMVAEGELDLHRFERLVADAAEARERGDHQRAALLLRDALAQWRGPALDGLESPLLRAAAARLEEMRLSAIEDRIEADTHVGSLSRLAAELTELVATHPLREKLRAHLMRVLYQLGRQAEALQVYQRTYTVLREDLGIEPSPSLQQLHQAILTGDPALAIETTRPLVEVLPIVEPGDASPSLDAPHQLPAPPRHLVGRSDQVRELGSGLWSAAKAQKPVLTVIAGAAGTGKSALALTVAQLVAEAFPDGQLFVPMRKNAPQEALGMLLRSIGRTAPLPDTVDERAALLRTALAGRRVLVVLDDVASAADLRPLLATQPGCAVLATSHANLLGLDGQVHVDIGALSHADALLLLTKLVGADRIAAEPCAADEIVRLCEGLPLAMRAVGARLAARPRRSLAIMTARLADDDRCLAELTAGDLDVQAAIGGNVAHLSTDDQASLCTIGHLPELSSLAIATLLGLTGAAAELLADRLVDARLIEDLGPAGYRLPRLTRLVTMRWSPR
jgi:DNA-binding SARP family transcriptional activator